MATSTTTKQEELRAAAAVLADAAAAARGFARSIDNLEIGRNADLPFKKLDALSRALEVATERWKLTAPRAVSALGEMGVSGEG